VCMVCSGRFPSEINDDLRQIGFDGYVMVDGALVEYKGDFVLKEAFTEKEMNYMVEQLHSHNCNFSYFHDNLTCFDPVPVPDHAAWMENVGFPYNVRSLEVTDETYKIYVVGELPFALPESLQKNPLFTGYGDIRKKGVSKASAIDFMCKYLNIPLKEVACFGDTTNDIEMLKFVPQSFCMGNGTDDAKRAAAKIIEDIDNDAIFKTCVNEKWIV
ncbi:MAG: HAD hydrolase family protein, partial [Erysipelotrichaceae bacterium]|nr:HAD hydrolase family protein [Erysipelotrichaceae bacterium]